VKIRDNIIVNLLERISFILGDIERRRGRFGGQKREEIARKNLSVVLRRSPTDDEIKLNFFYHALYHIQLVFLPKLIKIGLAEVNLPSNARDLIIESKKEGAIGVLAHIGIPEAAVLEFKKMGVEIHALVENLNQKYEKIFFNITRQNFGVKLHTNLKSMLYEMKNPRWKIFVFLVDRPLPGSREKALFGTFNMQDLPIRISEKFGLKIWVASALRVGSPKYKYGKEEEKTDLEKKEKSLGNWKIDVSILNLSGKTQEEKFKNLSEIIENQIRYSPLEWNPFFI